MPAVNSSLGRLGPDRADLFIQRYLKVSADLQSVPATVRHKTNH